MNNYNLEKNSNFLTLKKKILTASDTYDFIFTPEKRLLFQPGQFVSLTIENLLDDDRGNQRYFTIASSPTEDDVIFGIKIYQETSPFKKHLFAMNEGEKILVSSPKGNFLFPKNKKEKMVFIAGGIGITPFRSMIKYLTDKEEKRDIVLFYSNPNETDVSYKDIFNSAYKKLKIRTIYTFTRTKNAPTGWTCYCERINEKMIADEVPDYSERVFYVSGPISLVQGFKETLKDMNIAQEKIVTDYFPGY